MHVREAQGSAADTAEEAALPLIRSAPSEPGTLIAGQPARPASQCNERAGRFRSKRSAGGFPAGRSSSNDVHDLRINNNNYQ
ncbi:MAG: hypothetical protein CO107_05350 [Deltaproteobacteria bacterium CG_4_9_14_3_um_filter_51_14]|nr:MAG: hypothetical protein CO107_05350 [Deltaproteobacteria bacterium CG_4_9_14_3_um_filter_51_14]